MNDSYTSNPLIIIGVVLIFLGILVFCFGKKFFILRFFLGDRSMLGQIIVGTVICVVGFVFLFLSGFFS